MSFRCPQCDRVVYNRRSYACGFCGATLPPESGFTPAEDEAWSDHLNALRKPPRSRPLWVAWVGLGCWGVLLLGTGYVMCKGHGVESWVMGAAAGVLLFHIAIEVRDLAKEIRNRERQNVAG